MPVPVVLRPAWPGEAAALTELAIRSKGHWGYDAAFLAACRDELTVRPQDCDGGSVVVAEGAGLLGFYRLAGDPPVGELSDLFVDGPAIGRGIGAQLLGEALKSARRRGFTALTVDADPGAEGFYTHAGARRVGTVPSGSIAGRRLPRLEFQLAGAEAT